MSYYDYTPALTEEYFHGVPLTLDREPNPVFGPTYVEDVYRLKEVPCEAVRYSTEPIILPDKPWETSMQSPFALYDEDDGLYKIWYSTRHYQPGYEPDWETNLEAGNAGKFVCYAESTDGIHYVKPELDLYPFGPWKKNNIVFIEDDSGCGPTMGCVLKNPDKSDKNRKFIMIWAEGYGVRVSYSPDGIHWGGKTDVTNIPMDTSLVLAYEKRRKVWQLFGRPSMFAKHEKRGSEKDIEPNLNYRRSVIIMESPDLVNWSMPRMIYKPDYTMITSQADNVSYWTVGNVPIVYVHLFSVRNFEECLRQYMLPYLVEGEDLFHLETMPDSKPVMTYGEIGSFDEEMINFHGKPMTLFGDETKDYVYYCGSCKDYPPSSIGLAYFGHDRYCARVADHKGGWLLTREFYFDGSSIEINAEIMARGSITAEILFGDNGTVRGGRRTEGFYLEDSDAMTESSFRHTLTWHGSSDLSEFKGKAIYVRFHLTNAKLYTFTVKE